MRLLALTIRHGPSPKRLSWMYVCEMFPLHPCKVNLFATPLQLFAIDDVKTIKALSGNTVKVYTLFPGQTYAILYLFGPESLGGKGNIRLKIEQEVSRTGRSVSEIVEVKTPRY